MHSSSPKPTPANAQWARASLKKAMRLPTTSDPRLPQTKQTIAATTTPSTLVKTVGMGPVFRCYNHSSTDFANILFSTDPNVIGALGGAPIITAGNTGMQIPPLAFIDYAVASVAIGQTPILVTAWMDSGSGANVVFMAVKP